MDFTLLTPLRSLLSSSWFAAAVIIVVTVYLGALLWKILRSDEGFLLGYGNWVIGKWQTLRGAKTGAQPAAVQTPGAVPAGPQPATQPTTMPVPTPAAEPPPQRDKKALEQALEAKDRVLTLSRLLDGDLAYLMMSDSSEWEAQIMRGMQTIVSGVTRVMNLAGRCRCGFFILDDEEQHLELVVGEGYGKAKRPRLALDHSCAGRAFLTGEDYYCRDTASDPVYWHSEQGNRDFRSIACVPVRAGRAVFGVMCLDAREPNAFTTEDFAHLEVFAVKLAAFCAFHFLQATGVCQVVPKGES
ncbi:MAG TPA: GAF domain-containing protein [Symbiobacteriaceae bacterium]|jgi:putative methionine-R-sulfoxide reductase with GAF domain